MTAHETGHKSRKQLVNMVIKFVFQLVNRGLWNPATQMKDGLCNIVQRLVQKNARQTGLAWFYEPCGIMSHPLDCAKGIDCTEKFIKQKL